MSDPIRRPVVIRTQDKIPLTDESPMPFGKHGPAGANPRKLREVPAAYLLWLRGQDFLIKYPALMDWIEQKFADPEPPPVQPAKRPETVNRDWRKELEKLKAEL